MAKMSSLGLILVVVLAVVTVDSAPALNLETRDVAEAAEAYLSRLLDNPAVQDFIASLDDDSETVEVSKRGLIDLAGHGIAGAANLGGSVVRTGAGVDGGLAKTGVKLLENLFGSGANLVRNPLQTGTRFVDNTAKAASDFSQTLVGLELIESIQNLLRGAVADAVNAANGVVGVTANVVDNIAGAAVNAVDTGIGAAEDVAETAVDAAANLLDKRVLKGFPFSLPSMPYFGIVHG